MGNSNFRISSPNESIASASPSSRGGRAPQAASGRDGAALTEIVFHPLLTLERRRAERSRKPFVLMLLDVQLQNSEATEILDRVIKVALITKRETDLVGWYKDNNVLGIIFTEVNLSGNRPLIDSLHLRIEGAMVKHLGSETAARISISMHLFPQDLEKSLADRVGSTKLHTVSH